MDELELLKSRAYWVVPEKLMAGCYPGSLSEDNARTKIAWLLDQGVTFFLDLTREGELQPYVGYLPEAVSYQRAEIIDMGVPGNQDMIRILDTIDAMIESAQIVYVHCWAGRGRTGTVVGCFLVRNGLSGVAALDEIVRLRGGRHDSPEAEQQYEFVRNWEKGR